MSVNGIRWWQIAEAGDYLPTATAYYDHERRALRLRSWRQLTDFPTDRTSARVAAEKPRATSDAWGTWARIADDKRSLLASGADLPPSGTPGLSPLTIVPDTDPWGITAELTSDERISDCTWGGDGILFCTIITPSAGRVILVDRRRRWRALSLARENFRADRCVAAADGSVWLLDRTRRQLARVMGTPLPERGTPRNDAELGHLINDNRNPPRIVVCPHVLSAGEIVDLGVDHENRAVVLIWPTAADAVVDIISARNGSQKVCSLRGAVAPFALTTMPTGRVLILGLGLQEAVAFTPDAAAVDAHGERYPIPDWDGAPFIRGVPAMVGARAERKIADEPQQLLWWPQPIEPLAQQRHAEQSLVTVANIIDSNMVGTTWHRLHLEAVLPRGCAAIIYAAASDNASTPVAEWMAHAFLGPHVDLKSLPSAHAPMPVGTWVRQASDAAFHAGFLCAGQRYDEREYAGLFSVLLQHNRSVVRSLRGRYLHLRIELLGDGMRSPDIVALRIHGPRFSYRDRYLPEHYHEALTGADANAVGQASGADFLDRYLAITEDVLTPIENHIANAHLLHDPRSAPSAWLEWLAGWIGFTLDGALDENRRRACITHAMRLYRRRGTYAGLALALDLATGGQVRLGGIVMVEDFRLRRTFATIIGANLLDEDDPLLQGLVSSGNSLVGDTLFVGEDAPALQRELLALFGAGQLSTAEQQEVLAFYQRLAHRITILVHADLSDNDLRLVKRVVERETPAHLGRRIMTASNGLRVGLSALVDIDTWLGERQPRQVVTVDATTVGLDGFVNDLPTLDPRMDA